MMKADLSGEISGSYDSLGNLNIVIPESYIREIGERQILKSVRRTVRFSGKQKPISEYGDITGQLNRVYEAESSEPDSELAKIRAASVWGGRENW